MRIRVTLGLVAAVVVVACGGGGSGRAGDGDGRSDGAVMRDAARPADGAADAARRDATGPNPDGRDAGADAAADAAPVVDAAPDGAAGDAGRDGGPVGADAGPDAGASCDRRSDDVVDLFDRDDNVQKLRLFPTESGYDLFYGTVDSSTSPATFTAWYAPLSPAGSLREDPVDLEDEIWRHMAAAEDGSRYAAIVTSRDSDQRYVVTVDMTGPTPVVDSETPVPLVGRSHWHAAIAYNPVDGEWGVLWTEGFDIDPSEPGIVHTRLFFGRVAEDGGWIDGSRTALTGTDKSRSVTLSNWSNPMIWAGDRYAAVWGETDGVTAEVYLGRLSAAGTVTRTRVETAPRFSRGVVAWAGDERFGLAWGHYDGDHYNLRATVVEDGEAEEPIHLGDDDVYTNDADIAWDGSRFAVAFHQTVSSGSHLWHAIIDPDALEAEATETRVSDPDFDDHDWLTDLAWDGCRFALAHQHYLNPSAGRVAFFRAD